jgi:hypothetical protein
MNMETDIWAEMRPVREYRRADAQLFNAEIAPGNRPVIMRGLVNHWPAVAAGRKSPQALGELLRGYSTEKPIGAYYGEPRIRGRFFYGDELQGFNFTQRPMSLSALVAQLLQDLEHPHAPALYAGAVSVPEHLPQLQAQHMLELLDPSIPKRASIWIGNRTRIAAHFDESHNLVCVIGGRRRFTLFPPQQIRNLYFGPLDRSPAGTPISLVDFARPDYQRYPRLRNALEHAEVALLNPGDVLYMPSFWVHHAESLDAFGLMMNFWWQHAPRQLLSPYYTLMHSLLTIRGLAPAERAAWREVFDVYLFQPDSDPADYIPEQARGVLGPLTSTQTRQLMAMLQDSLEKVKAALKP